MNIFHKNNKRKNELDKPKNFFNYASEKKKFEVVISWLSQAEELIIELNEDSTLKVLATAEREIALPIYTDMNAFGPVAKVGKRFIAVSFEKLKNILEKNTPIRFVLLNIYSDNIQIQRKFFVNQYVIPENTAVKIGLPAKRPERLLNFLINYGQSHISIKKINFGLMKNGSEFSYLVNIQHDSNQNIIPIIGKAVEKISYEEKYDYPVDFTGEDSFFKNDTKYIIYERRIKR